MDDTRCEFWLEISEKLTMMIEKSPVYSAAGKLYTYDVTNTSSATPISEDDVTSVDGYTVPLMILLVNGTMPGPALEVYEGQMLVVHVKNTLKNQVTSIHWHGITHQGTPWMDGVTSITQCGIHPGQTFTYKFKAEPRGTTFYHAHVSLQTAYGIVGPLIIREKKQPDYEEIIMTVQDWSHIDMTRHLFYMTNGSFDNGVRTFGEIPLDRSGQGSAIYDSSLINGKGRYYDKVKDSYTEAPLTSFKVNQGNKYLFRLIGAASYYSFRISIDNHNLTIVSSDFDGVDNITVESVILAPGERYDFVVTADQPIENYWIRARLIYTGDIREATAILHYVNASSAEPTSARRTCTQVDTCLVYNCLFPEYPDEPNRKCVTYNDIKATEPIDPDILDTSNMKEFFLNFGFVGFQPWPPSINARKFILPQEPPVTQRSATFTPCEDAGCGPDTWCACTHSINIETGDVVQLVLSNVGSGRTQGHPIHIHGYTAHVLKIGYGTYNSTTGYFIGDSSDIECHPNVTTGLEVCNDPTWKNASWSNGNVPMMELARPPKKDTIFLSAGSYVVLRFKANNPGMWMLHCHMERHLVDGMTVIINESYSLIPPPPYGFPECHNFNEPDVMMPTTNVPSTTPIDPEVERRTFGETTFWAVVGSLIAVVVIEFLIICYVCHNVKSNKEDKYEMKGTENKGFS